MNNLFLAANTNISSLILVGVLIVLMVVYLVFGTINRRKQQEQAMKMLNELKVGDKVVTNAGIYGEIVSQRETDMGRIVVLKTGNDEDGSKASYITINASVILGLDHKKDLLLDENGNVIETEELKEAVMQPSAKPEDKESPEEGKGEEEPEDEAEKIRKRLASKRKHVATDSNE